MNKKALISSVAKTSGLTVASATKAVDAVFDAIRGSLAKGEPVQLAGFGTFEVKHRNARTAYNPRTKEMIEVPEANVPAFKPAKALKEIV